MIVTHTHLLCWSEGGGSCPKNQGEKKTGSLATDMIRRSHTHSRVRCGDWLVPGGINTVIPPPPHHQDIWQKYITARHNSIASNHSTQAAKFDCCSFFLFPCSQPNSFLSLLNLLSRRPSPSGGQKTTNGKQRFRKRKWDFKNITEHPWGMAMFTNPCLLGMHGKNE